MPELPEVQTTVNGLIDHITGLTIAAVWSNYNSSYFAGSDTIKDPKYFMHFKKKVLGATVTTVERRAKNILIHLDSGDTILVHMKMTGHLLYGTYAFEPKNKKDPWTPLSPASLTDPYNRHVRFLISFTNKKSLALSDVRRFAKVTLYESAHIHTSSHLKGIGPEPLEKSFDFEAFNSRIDLKPQGKIKLVLMDQTIIAGLGNIYADESLWRAGIHPIEKVERIPAASRKKLFDAIKKTLARGIDFGGDSTSDYRNVLGEKGSFHESHFAYQQTGKKCQKSKCSGIITRIVLGGRGTHFCPVHQKLSIKKSK